VSREGLERFRSIVFQDPDLQAQLMDASSLKIFIRRVQQAAGDRGCDVSVDDIQGAMAHNRQHWLGRWK
jgi:hypothetical protein